VLCHSTNHIYLLKMSFNREVKVAIESPPAHNSLEQDNNDFLNEVKNDPAVKGAERDEDQHSVNIADLGEFKHIAKRFDGDKNGLLDGHEVATLLREFAGKDLAIYYMKWAIVGSFIVVVILLISQTLLTTWVVELTKETRVTNSYGLVDSSSAKRMVATEQPRFYTLLSDIPNLPTVALNSLSQLSFTTVDGSFHVYSVSGTSVSFCRCLLRLT
jgi:hypothetical protein